MNPFTTIRDVVTGRAKERPRGPMAHKGLKILFRRLKKALITLKGFGPMTGLEGSQLDGPRVCFKGPGIGLGGPSPI